MSHEDAERLRKVQSFTQLAAYLRDELGWPFVSDDFEDISFEWTPEEMGIDKQSAAKIEEIRQLRPPTGNWPWGIFFVKFEKKRLPITVLRRALAGVVRKQRETANTGQRWAMEDLLFISSYGDSDSRQISFARFHQPPERKKALPTLKVLGWDEDDTELSLEHTAGELRSKLAWPEDDGEDVEAWRSRWSSAFTLTHRQVVRSSKDLASQLARLAQRIRDRISRVLSLETEKGVVRKLMAAFRESLIHDLDEAQFADMYAQTIAYGLLSARITDPEGGSADDLVAAMPVTNPFLAELMSTFLEAGGRRTGRGKELALDFDELGVNDVVELLNATDMEAVLRDFGDRNPQEDPVIHFFEGFLQEYDKKIRKDRGVFYTPRPVVSFIVRSVDKLLRTEFGLEDGLADTTTWREMVERIDDLSTPDGATPDQAFVQILDPATGTGTFLVEVIGLIHRTMIEKWEAGGHGKKKIEHLWNDYVSNNLLPRLHGYELMMAPYAIAHMKIGLKLYETGYCFKSDERVRVYLTNALEPAQDDSQTLKFAIPALAHEARAVNQVKRHRRITVVMGNPPYSLISANMNAKQRSLVDRYKLIDGVPIRERGALQFEKILNDDYVKFISAAEGELLASGYGVLGLITNHAYLDNPTMRGVRHSLLSSFDEAFFYDLGGSAKKSTEVQDENVFDIQQGVAICVAERRLPHSPLGRATYYARATGTRTSKYGALSSTTVGGEGWSQLRPEPPYYMFVPTDYNLRDEYYGFCSLLGVFDVHSIGCFTSKDHFVISRDPDAVAQNARLFRDSSLSDSDLCASFGINPKSAWNVKRSRERLRELNDEEIRKHVVCFTHRPFDAKVMFYHRSLVWSMAYPVNRNLLQGDNVALVTSRQLAAPPWSHVYCAEGVVEMFLMSNKTKEGNHVFPLWLLPITEPGQQFMGAAVRRPNLTRGFLDSLSRCLDLPQARHYLPRGVPAKCVFNYIYAILHSPSFRSRYEDFLRIDFPRIPMPGDRGVFDRLSCSGGELLELHLSRPSQRQSSTTIVGSGAFEVERVSYSDDTVWIDKVRTRGFQGVPQEVWKFHIGGYQVCKKWLKDRQAKGGKNPRPGRVLTDEDIEHYQKIVVALSETIRIMAEIDQVIESHGGWPGAFQTGDGTQAGDVDPGFGGASIAAEEDPVA